MGFLMNAAMRSAARIEASPAAVPVAVAEVEEVKWLSLTDSVST